MSSPPDDTPTPPSTMRRDLISAYMAAGARVGSLAIVSAILLRYTNEFYFAAFVLARAMLGICNYFFAGVAPALQRALAVSEASLPDGASNDPALKRRVLTYARKGLDSRRSEWIIFGNALTIGAVAALISCLALSLYSQYFVELHGRMFARHWVLEGFVFWFGFGQIFRSFSELPGACLQVKGHIALDNALIVTAEVLWVILVATFLSDAYVFTFQRIAGTYATSGFVLFLSRLVMYRSINPPRPFAELPPSPPIIRELLGFGALIVAGQLADFLYAPAATLMIQHFLGPRALAVYAPALQLDAALLLTVGAIATVLLPKTAVAHAAGKLDLVRQYYIRGTLVSGALLLIAAITVWALSSWIFQLWLGSSVPATRAILPLVLIHTVVGGSSAVGRSILIGMGKVKAFTISVLIAGVANVLLSIFFVTYLNLGLKGIILGTIIAVTGRCAIWTPWYVMRQLRR